MAEKKSFALRIEAETMKAIEKWAADEFRSVNGQIEWILHRALKEAGRGRGRPDAGTPGPADSPGAAGPPNAK
ncbi:MAG TPA: hypothetical protein VG052_11870 [Puia sp.]|jgi:hypothetical protein|nr:hypothetical protein [Puia sp.]